MEGVKERGSYLFLQYFKKIHIFWWILQFWNHLILQYILKPNYSLNTIDAKRGPNPHFCCILLHHGACVSNVTRIVSLMPVKLLPWCCMWTMFSQFDQILYDDVTRPSRLLSDCTYITSWCMEYSTVPVQPGFGCSRFSWLLHHTRRLPVSWAVS
jgi:hypothetical protein